MKRTFTKLLKISQKEKADMRTVALILKIGKVAEATQLRGIYSQPLPFFV